VRTLKRRWSGEDHVGVKAGLVQIRVDRDHEVERLKSLFESTGVGCGQRGIAGDRDQETNLAVTGSFDLVGQGCHRQLSQHLGEALGTTVPATGAK
jgi:hypothetical protein